MTTTDTRHAKAPKRMRARRMVDDNLCLCGNPWPCPPVTPAGTIIGQFPASSVADMILPWSEVGEGDLVLQEDELVLAEKVNVYQDTWNRETGETFTRVDVTWLDEYGHRFCSEHHGDRLTAVRRYQEG